MADSNQPGHAAVPVGGPQTPPDPSELPITFGTFVVSLASSAAFALGEAAAPEGGAELNLPLAKQTIDLLALLQEKTRGNLSDEESKLIEAVLYDLRLRFIDAQKRR
jgi:hypothetical protein